MPLLLRFVKALKNYTSNYNTKSVQLIKTLKMTDMKNKKNARKFLLNFLGVFIFKKQLL